MTGTGFIVGQRSGRFAFITNRHVLDLAWADPERFKGYELESVEIRTHHPRTDSPPRPSGPIKVDVAIVKHHTDATIDIAGFPVDEEGICVPDESLTLDNWISRDALATRQLFQDQIHAGELVFFPGFPEWYDRNGDRPLMRIGAIVSDPSNDYRYTNEEPNPGDGRSQFAFEAFSTSGNSGSPIFISSRGATVSPSLDYSGITRGAYLVGINAGHFNDNAGQHVGLSRAYKAYEISNFIENVLRQA